MSWVIICKKTGEAILETYEKRVVDKINTSNYKIVPILEYLQGLNKQIKFKGQ